jgi:2'-deoxymugineic-acid 2'-dioxygenase / mugineic-acid 3-dioxygenase
MLMQTATNGVLKSIEHRAMTNAALARTSVATFIMPTADIPIGPAEELVGEGNPPRYRTVTFDEFMRVYKTVGARRESVEKAFKL